MDEGSDALTIGFILVFGLFTYIYSIIEEKNKNN